MGCLNATDTNVFGTYFQDYPVAELSKVSLGLARRLSPGGRRSRPGLMRLRSRSSRSAGCRSRSKPPATAFAVGEWMVRSLVTVMFETNT